MITVATVLKSGGIYNASHVEKIRDMVAKYLPQSSFICLSDVEVPCGRIPLTDNLPGWWSKLELFKIHGPVLFFDLDTVIRDDISDIVQSASKHDFVILRDFYRRGDGMQSSMMYWSKNMCPVYDLFKRIGDGGLYSDQEFIETAVRKAVRWQDITDGVVSYKVDVMKRGLKSSDKIIIFHGSPRPWEISDNLALECPGKQAV